MSIWIAITTFLQLSSWSDAVHKYPTSTLSIQYSQSMQYLKMCDTLKSSCPILYHSANLQHIEFRCLSLTFYLQIKVCLESANCNYVKFYCKYSQPTNMRKIANICISPPASRADFIVAAVKTLCDRKTPAENNKQNQNGRNGWKNLTKNLFRMCFKRFSLC